MKFSKNQRYETPWGVVRMLTCDVNGNGKTYGTAVIVDLSLEAKQQKWTNGSYFFVHEDDSLARGWKLLGTTFTERGIDKSK